MLSLMEGSTCNDTAHVIVSESVCINGCSKGSDLIIVFIFVPAKILMSVMAKRVINTSPTLLPRLIRGMIATHCGG